MKPLADLHELETPEGLLQWMLEVAQARENGAPSKTRIVNLKFSRATLHMWIERAEQSLKQEESRC